MNTYLTQKLIFAILIFFSLAAILIFIIFPTLSDIGDLRQSIISQKTELEERYNRRVSTKFTLQNLRTIKTELYTLYHKIFATKGREIDFIAQLETLAGGNDIEQKLRLETNLTKKFAHNAEVEIPLFLDLRGDYLNIIRYLYELERLPSLIIPQTFEIKQAGSENGFVTVRIQARTFWTEI